MTNSELNNITDDRAVDVLRDEYRLGVHEMEKKEQFIRAALRRFEAL